MPTAPKTAPTLQGAWLPLPQRQVQNVVERWPLDIIAALISATLFVYTVFAPRSSDLFLHRANSWRVLAALQLFECCASLFAHLKSWVRVSRGGQHLSVQLADAGDEFVRPISRTIAKLSASSSKIACAQPFSHPSRRNLILAQLN